MVEQEMASLQGSAIIPELCVYVTLWYLAGGLYTDIFYLIGISQASFYYLLWKMIKTINNCPEAQISWPYTKERQLDCATGFTSISTNHALRDCVAVLDGYHLQTITPSKKEVHNVQSYFSGHYQTYGVNIQATCDHNCHFLFIGITGPGVMDDRKAIHECRLSTLVESTHGVLYCIGDCAYTSVEKLLPIYRSKQAAKERYDNFNFYTSQLHIHIEMAFGVMVKRWGLLQRPITISIHNIKHLIWSIGGLHNFCINEQILHHSRIGIFGPKNTNFSPEETVLSNAGAEFDGVNLVYKFAMAHLNNRECVVQELKTYGYTRKGGIGDTRKGGIGSKNGYSVLFNSKSKCFNSSISLIAFAISILAINLLCCLHSSVPFF